MIDSKNRRSRANQTIAEKGISMVSFVQNLSLLYVLFKRVLEEKTQSVVWRYVLCRVFIRGWREKNQDV